MYIMCMNITDFWNRVNNAIKSQNITRKKFAESVNIPYNTFKSWLYYERSVEVETAYTIAVALGVSLEYLVTGHDRRTEGNYSSMTEIKKLVDRIQEELIKA